VRIKKATYDGVIIVMSDSYEGHRYGLACLYLIFDLTPSKATRNEDHAMTTQEKTTG
jgi:hypothetical protein